MGDGATIGNDSGGYKSFDGDVNAGDIDDFSLPGINAVDYSKNLTIDRELLEDWLQQMKYEYNFDPFTQTVLITLFALLIAFGAAGNSLVCFVVARNPAMRTPRNIFIINLAISDLTFCLFTQPFNLLKVLMPAWRLGAFMCKFVCMCSGATVFVSTISITAIALDRFQVIVYPTQDSVKRFGPLISLLTVWFVSLLLASPLAVFSVLDKFEPFESIVLYETCVENPELESQRRAYSLASIIFQYLLPVVIVTVAHVRISHKLRSRMVTLQQRNAPPAAHADTTTAGHRHRRHQEQSTSTTATTAEGGSRALVTVPLTAAQKEKRRLALQRKRKTNLLLVMIAVVFALSWLPLNVCNIVTDFDLNLRRRLETQVGGMVYPICHLLTLSSACCNPLLYGWLNDNFRREFIKALCCCSSAAKASARAGTGATTVGGARTNGGGGRSMAVATSVVGGVRPSRRRRLSQMSNDGDIELQQHHAERHVEESANEEEQLESLANK